MPLVNGFRARASGHWPKSSELCINSSMVTLVGGSVLSLLVSVTYDAQNRGSGKEYRMAVGEHRWAI